MHSISVIESCNLVQMKSQPFHFNPGRFAPISRYHDSCEDDNGEEYGDDDEDEDYDEDEDVWKVVSLCTSYLQTALFEGTPKV